MNLHMTMRLDGSPDPMVRVDEAVKAAKLYADAAGLDHGDAVMTLLSAAARLYLDMTRDARAVPPAMQTAFENSVSCARDMILLQAMQDAGQGRLQ